MATLKTQPGPGDVNAFLDQVTDERRRNDARTILALMGDITGEQPRMWGSSMVGFGSYHYRYDSGREGDWFMTGFSPRKAALTLYIMAGFSEYDELMSRLGRYKTGKSCLYIRNLDDVDHDVLSELIRRSVAHMRAQYPEQA